MTGGIWSLTQTLNGFSSTKSRWFGYALSYSPTGTFAVGAEGTYSLTGMYELFDV